MRINAGGKLQPHSGFLIPQFADMVNRIRSGQAEPILTTN